MKFLSLFGILTAVAALSAFASTTNPTPAATGSVEGRITFDGDAPEVKPLEISEKQAEGCCPSGVQVDTTDRSLLIGADKGIANVVIEISGKGIEAPKAPEKPFHIDQKMCRFEPHIMVVPVGSTIEYLNSDSISHNVHTYATKNDSMNKTIAPGAKESQVFEKTDKIGVKCDIHPWMAGWIYVTDTPFHAVTDANGNFKIEGLPPGEYKVDFWHERLGKGKADVTVEDGKTAKIEESMGEEKKGGRRRRR